MAYEIQYAKSPKWANSEKTMIDLTVKFSHLDNEVPFTASLDDPELHGRELYTKAWNGTYGAVADYVTPEPVIIIPSSVQMRQFRLELLNRGLLQNVSAAITSIQDETKRQQVQIEWEYATVVNKDAEWVSLLANAMNLSSSDLNDIFLEASKR